MKQFYKSILRLAVPCAIGVAGVTPAFAVPAYPGPITVEQPDGSTLEIILRGDERGHTIQTPDGYRLVRDEDGFLVYATIDSQGMPAASSLRATDAGKRGSSELQFLSTLVKDKINESFERSARMKAMTRSGGEDTRYLCSGAAFPAKGSPRALVVLVEYQDVSFSMDEPADFFSRLLNEEGFNDYNATGSARDFFIENSNGVFTPQFDVYGPVQLAYPMRHYGANDYFDQDVAPEEMVIEACEALDPDVDFSVYDTNGDGQIDNVFIFYAGYGEADSSRPNTVWPHSADIVDFQLGTDYYYDGLLLNRYACTNEIDAINRRPDGIGTFVHEFSHVMGLPDLYATSYTDAFTPGDYCTLDHGPYNNNGRTPPHYSSFERYSLDWLEPELLELTGEYTLEPLHTSNHAYIIETQKETEFFLLENRQQECCDAYIPGHGMLVWHIDYNQSVWDRNVVNNTRSHQYVDILEADNKRTEATRDGDTFPGTSNVTTLDEYTRPDLLAWDGSRTAVAISDIREEDGKILFTVEGKNKPSVSVDEISASEDSVKVDGRVISNVSSLPVEIFGLTGLRIALLPVGESVELPEGIYIIVAGDSRLKLHI